jgi:enterochelin esterase-like enzyme
MDLRLPGSARLAKRATVFTPKVSRGAPLPVLVLLHGLGETGNDRDGAYAWVERYGLASSYERLLQPPVERTLRRQLYLRPPRSRAINRELSLRPFRGMILVCPYTPNVFRMNTTQALDDYAAWIVEVLLPEVRARTPARAGMRWTGLDGCSLGGFISYQVFQRRPEAFFTCGGVQAAIGKAVAPQYAQRIHDIVQRLGPRRIHVETSSQDPYHDANVELARELSRRGIEHQLRVPPGPHNQPWLIEAGTLEMLLWHDRQLWSSET